MDLEMYRRFEQAGTPASAMDKKKIRHLPFPEGYFWGLGLGNKF